MHHNSQNVNHWRLQRLSNLIGLGVFFYVIKHSHLCHGMSGSIPSNTNRQIRLRISLKVNLRCLILNTVVNFAAFRKEKQQQYEREALKDFSLELLGRHYRHLIKGLKSLPGCPLEPAEEHCYDMAVESFLIGSAYSKFAKYGESPDKIMQRSKRELDTLAAQLFYHLNQPMEETAPFHENTLRTLTEEYVTAWWLEGYSKGIQRHKTRMKK